MVEFALVLPALLLIMLLALDAGRLFFGWVGLQNAARIGANFAGDNPTAWPASPSAAQLAIQAQYATQIRNDAAALNCTLPATLPPPTFPDASPNQYSIGSRVQVNLSCTFSLIVPFLAPIMGGTGSQITLSAQTVYPIRSGNVAIVGGIPSPAPTATPAPSASATPAPSASATPAPSGSGGTPTPSPTAPMCIVPNFILSGIGSNQASKAWTDAGFTAANLTITVNGSHGNYTIAHESVAGVDGEWDGQSENCATFALTVGP